MKVAVILAILQMSLGICMKGCNNIYFKQTIDFVFEFIPQIVLLLVLFGWMDLLIIGKWFVVQDIEDCHRDPLSQDYNNTYYAPAIITTMIDMFLNFGDNTNSDGSLKYNYIYGDNQKYIEIAFLVIALLCVPIMLFTKPCLLSKKGDHHTHDEHVRQESVTYEKSNDGKTFVRNEKYEQIYQIIVSEGVPKEHEAFGDLFIHSLIETIEFVLGTVSNTASYLRLWALSLAHS
jgi:V-type H+-transporting ATPase subunit a